MANDNTDLFNKDKSGLPSTFKDKEHYLYSVKEIDVLHKRAEKYLRGEGVTYTVAASHDKIRAQRKALR